MPKTLKLALAAALVALSALGFAPPAGASHGQIAYFEASNTLLSASTRPRAFAQMEHLGVKALRVELYWASVAPRPTSAARPSFEAANPVSYNWASYDAILGEAQRLGWKVLLTITSPVPRWATSNKKAPYVTRPDDLDFREFVTAVARPSQIFAWPFPDGETAAHRLWSTRCGNTRWSGTDRQGVP